MSVINKSKKLGRKPFRATFNAFIARKSLASLHFCLFLSLSAFVFSHWLAARHVSPPPSKEEKPDLSYTGLLSLTLSSDL